MVINEKIELGEYGSLDSIEIDIKDAPEYPNIYLTFHDGEPEDNSLARNFNGCLRVVDALKAAYAAGVRGDGLELNREEVTDE